MVSRADFSLRAAMTKETRTSWLVRLALALALALALLALVAVGGADARMEEDEDDEAFVEHVRKLGLRKYQSCAVTKEL